MTREAEGGAKTVQLVELPSQNIGILDFCSHVKHNPIFYHSVTLSYSSRQGTLISCVIDNFANREGVSAVELRGVSVQNPIPNRLRTPSETHESIHSAKIVALIVRLKALSKPPAKWAIKFPKSSQPS